jgi:hypothetical protein
VDKNKKQIITMVVLMLVAAGAFAYNMGFIGGGAGSSSSKKSKDGGTADGSSIGDFKSVFDDVQIDIQELIQNIQPVEFIYDEVKTARDPSVPITKGTVGTNIEPIFDPDGPAVDPTSLVYLAQLKTVTGIIYDEKDPIAVIDGSVVNVGFEFRETPDAQPIIVKTIGRDSVTLSIPSEDQEITKELSKEQ